MDFSGSCGEDSATPVYHYHVQDKAGACEACVCPFRRSPLKPPRQDVLLLPSRVEHLPSDLRSNPEPVLPRNIRIRNLESSTFTDNTIQSYTPNISVVYHRTRLVGTYFLLVCLGPLLLRVQVPNAVAKPYR